MCATLRWAPGLWNSRERGVRVMSLTYNRQWIGENGTAMLLGVCVAQYERPDDAKVYVEVLHVHMCAPVPIWLLCRCDVGTVSSIHHSSLSTFMVWSAPATIRLVCPTSVLRHLHAGRLCGRLTATLLQQFSSLPAQVDPALPPCMSASSQLTATVPPGAVIVTRVLSTELASATWCRDMWE